MDNQLLDSGLIEESQDALEMVSAGLRFANFIVDTIIGYIFVIALMIPFLFIFPELFDDNVDDGKTSLIFKLIGIAVFLLYYTMFEGLTKGRSIGKFITGTRAVTYEGEPITVNKAFKRALCRCIPLDAFSFLGIGHGWHDRWTDTMVVKERDYQRSIR